MKTIEQKAKAYDNIIEKANKMHSENCKACQICIEELIPELKESEDEKIREWLINLVKSHIEWLEDRIKEQLSNGQVYGGELNEAKDAIVWLENIGEQQESLCDKCRKEQPSHFCQDITELGRCYLEHKKQGEQNLANSAKTCKGEQKPAEFDENGKSILTPFEAELFSMMSDAWQGYQRGEEVNIAAIVKEHSAELLERAYEQKPIIEMKSAEESLGIDSNTYNEIVDECIYGDADKVEPKFKVKYAGSEYNAFETKDIAGVTFYGIEDEPNHIDYVKAENCEIISGYAIKENGSPYPTKPAVFSEQKPAWSEESSAFKDKLLELFQRFRWYCKDKTLTNGDIIDYVDAHIQELIDTVQNKPWSEEDEKNYQMLQKIICDSDITAKMANKLSDWLKPLKNRVQPKQEWNEDTQQWIDAIIFDYESWYDADKDHRTTIQAKINILKSLKERYTWKPSDEQIGVIEAVINNRSFQRRHLDSLYADLKKLKA